MSFVSWVDRGASDEAAFRIIAGTARQMGLEIVD
jgi:ribosomal protein L11